VSTWSETTAEHQKTAHLPAKVTTLLSSLCDFYAPPRLEIFRPPVFAEGQK